MNLTPEQISTMLMIGIIGIVIFLAIKIIQFIRRGLYKIATLYLLGTAGGGGGLTVLINQLSGGA